MKERLIYLLEGTLKDWECDVQPETLLQIAEHLIENGVLVAPCAIETTVYATHVSNRKGVVKGEVIRYAFNIHGDLCVDVEYENGFNWRHLPHEFGKVVFFSRGAAEKALERSENGKS